ncbi:hypothetical protein GE09DRAFT_201219 [Coniochaeta sp. 2T2.1]|nr:hypothetical protein GE09DRAFT_201219 [Coniochaeta sp. 2T2.1]
MISPTASRAFTSNNARILTRALPLLGFTQLRLPQPICSSQSFHIKPATKLNSLNQTRTMSSKPGVASHNDLNRNSLFNMKGKVAFVTGGGSGIGLMATQALAVNGAKVYITGRTQSKLDTVVSTYGKDIEGSIVALQGDVTSKEDIARLAKEISSKENGVLHILVNNAGVSGDTVSTESSSAQEMKANLFDAEAATFDDWTSTYKTNVASVYFVTAAFLPLLQKSSDVTPGWSGTVINTSSISGLVKSAQHHFSYNASKAATIHLNRMLAAEIAEQGLKVRVNTIAPGVFPSEMTADESDEAQKSELSKDKYKDKVPAARPGNDIDMAQTVLFFANNQYLNGQVVAVDGGYTIRAGE